MKRRKASDPAQLAFAFEYEPKAEGAGTPVMQPPAAPAAAAADATADDIAPDRQPLSQEPRLWRDAGWTARVTGSEQDAGWAVEMTMDGEAGPTLVAPWTTDRDKKNPKPLDAAAFAGLVKAASELRRRHEQQLRAMLHKSVTVAAGAATVTVTLDVVPDDDDAYATLAAFDEAGAQLAQVRVTPDFALSKASAAAWVASGFRRAGR